MYKDIITQGATGGKLLGSGGGGFLLFYAKNNKKIDILKKLKNKKIINFEIDLNGTNVLYRT
jgi:D-glycero-alpha-D-manno-heptose-7-phosphate kinase